MAKRQTFDLQKELSSAWDYLWADNLDRREHDYRGHTYFLTATDLERRVRASAEEQMRGLKPESQGRDTFHSGIRISTGERSNLLGSCRDWLFARVRMGKLEHHNHGRGHCSGERFRPMGQPLSPQESRSREKRSKVALVHYRETRFGHSWSGPICTLETRLAKKGGGSGRSWRKSSVSSTREVDRVTCPRCLKLLKAAAHEAQREVSIEVPHGTTPRDPYRVRDNKSGKALWTTWAEDVGTVEDWCTEHGCTVASSRTMSEARS